MHDWGARALVVIVKVGMVQMYNSYYNWILSFSKSSLLLRPWLLVTSVVGLAYNPFMFHKDLFDNIAKPMEVWNMFALTL